MARILVVEDEEILREAYRTILLSAGFKVELACDGEEALRKCKKEAYDLILLDLMMPKVDGVTFLQRANLKQKAPDTKVILFTNLSSGGNINKALACGANNYLLKSDLSPRDLIAFVNKSLPKNTKKQLKTSN